MNQTINDILSRRSCKAYRNEMPTKEQLDTVIEAGLYAASGRNLQGAIMLCVTDRALRDRLSALNAAVMGAQGDPFYNAPAVIVVLADKTVRTSVYDGSLVMGNLMLAAHSIGLGSCWIHRAKEEFEMPEYRELLKTLGFNEEYEGIGNCIVGYADMQPAEKPRKENWVYYI
mgnify:CR=1 FL=1